MHRSAGARISWFDHLATYPMEVGLQPSLLTYDRAERACTQPQSKSVGGGWALSNDGDRVPM
jgi:hypothetical protein